MGIRSDLDEIRGLWNRGSWLVRGFAILLFVLALGPVASLSDTIFQFRGFIRDGIEFYETWIRDPFRETLYLVFGIKLGTLWSSVMIYLIIATGGLLRDRFVRVGLGPAIATFVGAVIGVSVATIVTYALSRELILAARMDSTLALLLLLAFIWAAYLFSKDVENKTMYWVSTFSPILLVGILGAISNALSRPI